MANKRICFKCRGEVPIENDAGHLGYLVFSDPTGLQCGARTLHLVPVIIKDEKGNDMVVCGGSPYRAQYLDGQPRDHRGYIYFQAHEVAIRAAYKQLQELAKEFKEKQIPSSNNVA